YRGSMAGLCTPLPTLRLYLHRHLRTAWGRCGSLFLHRKGLSPSTPCRFIRRTADISLCSGLQVCSPPRSYLPLRILPQGSQGFYIRAERGSRASDILTVRIHAIDGTGTCTPLDFGLVGCSFPVSGSLHAAPPFPRLGPGESGSSTS